MQSFGPSCLLLGLFTLVSCQQNSAQYKCPDGWELFEEKPDGKCILFSKQKLTYPDAKEACKAVNTELISITSSDKNDFLFPYVAPTSSGHWVGLEKDATTSYKWISGEPAKWYYWGESPHLTTVGAGCVYIDNDGLWYSTPNCEYQRRNYICEGKPECADGRFGSDCENECFCASKPCDPITGECVYGCEPGFTGPNCDEPKEVVNVAYYCVNSHRLGKYVYLRIDPKGADYADVYGLMADGFPAPDCKHKRLEEEDGILNFKLEMPYDHNENESLCGAEKTGMDSYTWRLWLQEVKGVLSAHDQVVQLSCNFSDAETMDREKIPFIQNDRSPHVLHVNETREAVTLKIVDPHSGDEVTEAAIGTRVKLVMELNKLTGLAAKGISSFGCMSENFNGTQRVDLTDNNGCPLPHSPVTAMRGDGIHLETAIFPIFSFPKTDEIVFECSFEFCFQDDAELCDDRCDFKNKTRYKREAKEKKTLQTYLRILPSENDKSSSAFDAKPTSNEGTLLSYINPLTVAMFVLVVSLVVVLYVVVTRSMRRSVKQIKNEVSLDSRSGEGHFV